MRGLSSYVLLASAAAVISGCPSPEGPGAPLELFSCEVVVVAAGSPVADPGLDQTVEEGATVVLDGSTSMQVDGTDPLQFAWTQTSGVSVELTGADTAMASWEAPDVASEAQFTFSLTVTDEIGQSCPAEVFVTVTDPSAEP